MPVILHNIPSTASAFYGTRDRLTAWLEEHVGPISHEAVQYNKHLDSSDYQFFDQLLNEYKALAGTEWLYLKDIKRMIIVRAETWSLWQMTAHTGSFANISFSAAQFAIYIEDEQLAVQFKLSCL
jgi:hypothetical protein